MRKLPIFLGLLFLGCAHLAPDTRKSNLKNCPKTVTVYMDEMAAENLQIARTNMTYVLGLVNLNFASQGIGIRYDLNSLRVKKWSYRFEYLQRRRNRGEEDKNILAGMRNKKFGAEDDSSDVHIFITGHMVIGEGNVEKLGWRFLKFGTRGRGSMLIGNARIEPMHYDHERDIYLITLAATIAHEQGHLFGLSHVDDANSLMHPITIYGRTRLLDVSSKKRLQDILSIEDKCAAR